MPAEFYKGFVFERGASARLTIEGNRIEYDGDGPFTAKLPRPTESGPTEVSGGTPSELAQQYIEHSGLLESREREKKKHLEELRKGSERWNEWRLANPLVQPMLAGLTKEDRALLDGVNEQGRLKGCDFSYANLCQAQLQDLHLEDSNFHQAILANADLTGAHLERANFCRTDFYATVLKDAWLDGANLQGVQLAMTDLTGARLTGCKVYGLSAWDLTLKGATQGDLIIQYRPTARQETEAALTDAAGTAAEGDVEEVWVDDVDLASFMYFVLNNRNLSRIIDEAGRRWVLLLGRFSEGRKKVLVELKKRLKERYKEHGFVPIIFDFPPPQEKDLLATIDILGGLSAFVIADITDPRSALMEVQEIASHHSVPIIPIIMKGKEEVATFSMLRRRSRWVAETLAYDDQDDLLNRLDEEIVKRAQAMRRDLDGEGDRVADTGVEGAPR